MFVCIASTHKLVGWLVTCTYLPALFSSHPKSVISFICMYYSEVWMCVCIYVAASVVCEDLYMGFVVCRSLSCVYGVARVTLHIGSMLMRATRLTCCVNRRATQSLCVCVPLPTPHPSLNDLSLEWKFFPYKFVGSCKNYQLTHSLTHSLTGKGYLEVAGWLALRGRV